MALVVGATIDLNPSDVLEKALEDFRAVLPPSRQNELEETAKKSSEDRSVILLTAEINRCTKSRCRGSLGPKVIPLLNFVHAFSSVLDSFANANPFAAVAWGAIKVFLLFATNFVDYFESLTDAIAEIGRTAPRIRETAALFISSKSLQNQVYLYFAAILDFCRKSVKVCHRSSLQHFVKATFISFQREFATEIKNLHLQAVEMREEISAAETRVIVEEARFGAIERAQNQSFRSKFDKISAKGSRELAELKQWRIDNAKRQIREDQETIRANLSTYNQQLTFQTIKRQCIAESATWFEKEEVSGYHEWTSSTSPLTLVYSANIGHAKSTISANIVEFVTFKYHEVSHIAYFFCDRTRAQSLKVHTIIGCIVRQLLESEIGRARGEKLERLKIKSKTQDEEELISLVLDEVSSRKPIYILIDGLHELDDSSSKQVIKAIHRMMPPKSASSAVLAPLVKVWLTTRPDRLDIITENVRPLILLEPDAGLLRDDMLLVITRSLETKIEAGQLLLREETVDDMIALIQGTLISKANGMYLWVKLVIDQLCNLKTDAELLERISTIPEELAETYDWILRGINYSSIPNNQTLKLLKWALGSVRPLKVSEMQEALTVEWDQTTLAAKLLPDVKQLIINCRGLIFADDIEEMVHVVHSTLTDYLMMNELSEDESLSASSIPQNFRFDSQTVHTEIFESCLTYLSFSDFHRQMIPMKSVKSLNAVPTYVTNTARGSRSRLSVAAERAMRHLRKSPANLEPLTQESLNRLYRELQAKANTTELKPSLDFFSYASEAWFVHANYVCLDTNHRAFNPLGHLLQSQQMSILRPWLINQQWCQDLNLWWPTKDGLILKSWRDVHPIHRVMQNSSMEDANFLAWSFASVNKGLMRYTLNLLMKARFGNWYPTIGEASSMGVELCHWTGLLFALVCIDQATFAEDRAMVVADILSKSENNSSQLLQSLLAVITGMFGLPFPDTAKAHSTCMTIDFKRYFEAPDDYPVDTLPSIRPLVMDPSSSKSSRNYDIPIGKTWPDSFYELSPAAWAICFTKHPNKRTRPLNIGELFGEYANSRFPFEICHFAAIECQNHEAHKILLTTLVRWKGWDEFITDERMSRHISRSFYVAFRVHNEPAISRLIQVLKDLPANIRHHAQVTILWYAIEYQHANLSKLCLPTFTPAQSNDHGNTAESISVADLEFNGTNDWAIFKNQTMFALELYEEVVGDHNYKKDPRRSASQSKSRKRNPQHAHEIAVELFHLYVRSAGDRDRKEIQNKALTINDLIQELFYWPLPEDEPQRYPYISVERKSARITQIE